MSFLFSGLFFIRFIVVWEFLFRGYYWGLFYFFLKVERR